ncbi:MAG: hypothetical protein R3A48_02195 [Polyangiales bacterium]
MSTTRTAWHPAFTIYLRERAPPWVEVRAEVPLSAEPLRVDDLLTLRPQHVREPLAEGQSLRGMWRHLLDVLLVEFKSRAREFRRGDLHRLFAYGALWCAEHEVDPAGVTLMLVVPRIHEALRRELDEMGLTIALHDDGYHTVRGHYLRVVIAELRVIAEHEGDDVLRWFATKNALSLAAIRWIRQHVHTRSDDMSMEIDEDLEGFNQYARELMKKLPLEDRLADLAPEERLAGLAPEERLAGLAPQERLAGLAPEEALLALPDVTLRSLPESYVDGLAPAVRDAIRRRLAR